jgi:hypothetical protein
MSAHPRRRGRPKGSKNKRQNLSGASVATICEYHKFNPTSFLAMVANGTDVSEQWTKDDRLRAASKLHDSIHHNKSLIDKMEEDAIDGQYEIVFVEASESFSLPGEASTESTEGVLRPESVQRAGVSSQDGQDSLRNQSQDSQGTHLP